MRSDAAQNNVRRARAAGSPLLSALLLVLFAHAFMVSATHFHRTERAGVAAAAAAATLASSLSCGESNDAEDGRDASFHAQCLLCRLQRNFVSDLYHADSQTAATPHRHEGDAARPARSFSQDAFLVPAGRAPPPLA